MDAEDLSKAALIAIDDWLDEEIVGFEPNESYQVILVFGRASSSIAFCDAEMLFLLRESIVKFVSPASCVKSLMLLDES